MKLEIALSIIEKSSYPRGLRTGSKEIALRESIREQPTEAPSLAAPKWE
ncbi:hypothetical protein [Thalassoglobus polymorphus]|nr:hypothetical protein [Thalassoglobus polymorphus]